MGLCAVRTIAVQHWLRGLQRADGTPLANPTKAKIRNLMSVLFNHAIRYEWLEQGRNPITLVRQSAQRKWTPEILEPHEIHNLLLQLSSCFRLTNGASGRDYWAPSQRIARAQMERC